MARASPAPPVVVRRVTALIDRESTSRIKPTGISLLLPTARQVWKPAKPQHPTRGARRSGRILSRLKRAAGLVQTACDLARRPSDSSLHPLFSVFSEHSAVHPLVREREIDHRELKELREPLYFNGVRVSRLGGRKTVIWWVGIPALHGEGIARSPCSRPSCDGADRSGIHIPHKTDRDFAAPADGPAGLEPCETAASHPWRSGIRPDIVEAEARGGPGSDGLRPGPVPIRAITSSFFLCVL